MAESPGLTMSILRFVKNWPFVLLGLLTLALFLGFGFVNEASGSSCGGASEGVIAPDGTVVRYEESSSCDSPIPEQAMSVLTVLIIPIWLMLYALVLTKIAFLPLPLAVILGLPVLMLPYAGADLLFRGIRKRIF